MELSFDAGLLVWTLITFACLLAVLARFAFRPLRRIMEDREGRIRGSLEKAEEARRDAERILAENTRRIEEARQETRRIIGEGHRIVGRMKRETAETSREEAARAVEQARAEIERETRKSLDELKNTVAGLSVRIARQVIKEGLDEERHRQLAHDFIERLKKSHERRS